MQLAELLQLLQRQIVARQVQQRIEKHGGVAVRQHEPVAVRPGRIGWIMPQMAAPQNLGNVRHAHRRAGVARLRLLHGVNRQEPQRIPSLRGAGDGCPVVTSMTISLPV